MDSRWTFFHFLFIALVIFSLASFQLMESPTNLTAATRSFPSSVLYGDRYSITSSVGLSDTTMYPSSTPRHDDVPALNTPGSVSLSTNLTWSFFGTNTAVTATGSQPL
eukprot:TRINITY_DN5295_c0_g1_i1.p2 TRINITY_DN5295_c0_g1~~TRINITY_DN5295_c0_g1_i1.p2  ORF type:complete len:117 (-),score=5.12 TRINITY_DN5295_c0_g1_i1:353-676(-)